MQSEKSRTRILNEGVFFFKAETTELIKRFMVIVIHTVLLTWMFVLNSNHFERTFD